MPYREGINECEKLKEYCRRGPTELQYAMFKNCPITCGVHCGKYSIRQAMPAKAEKVH